MSRIAICILTLATLLSTGCAFLVPKTDISFNPATGQFRLVEQREIDVTLGEVSVTKGPDGTFEFKLTASQTPALTLSQKGAPIIRENVPLVLAQVEIHKAIGANIDSALSRIPDIVTSLVPIFNSFNVPQAQRTKLWEALLGLGADVQAAKNDLLTCPTGDCK